MAQRKRSDLVIAYEFQGWIDCGGHSVYAEWRRPAPRSPSILLLNGLSDSHSSWDTLLAAAADPTWGIIRLDFRGQGRSLERELEIRGDFSSPVTVEEQSRDLEKVLEQSGIQGPLTVIGTSYGGGIALQFAATHPERIQKLILFVPYLIRLDQALPPQRLIAAQLEYLQRFGIFSSTTDALRRHYREALWRYMHHRYSRVIQDAVIREAAVQLSFGIMSFNAFSVLKQLPSKSVNLISAGRDTLIPQNLFWEMWYRLPASARGTWLHVEDGEHQITTEAPHLCAKWVRELVENSPFTADGGRFRGECSTLQITSDQGLSRSFALAT